MVYLSAKIALTGLLCRGDDISCTDQAYLPIKCLMLRLEMHLTGSILGNGFHHFPPCALWPCVWIGTVNAMQGLTFFLTLA